MTQRSVALLAAALCTTATAGSEADLLRKIDREIGSARCQNDSQCRVLPIGASACGGPDSYRAWSTLEGNARTLADLAARYTQRREQAGAAGGLSDLCVVRPEPSVYCERQGTQTRCVLSSTGQARR